jgi:chromosomal replication initiation ATPase DnaA
VAEAGPVAVEDVGPGVDERALFHLLNATREAGVALVLTARQGPEAWGLSIADLASRLRATAPVQLDEPDDALLEALLAKLFADRQVVVEPSLPAYLAARMERSYRAAAALVEALDREALAAKTGIGRAVVARVLAAAGEPAEGVDEIASPEKNSVMKAE